MKTNRRVIVAWLAFLASHAPAGAQPFYAGKQITVLVNYDAGGPTDIEARTLARHIAKHIDGNPRLVVQYMGGASGLIGTKYLGEVAPRDGSMVGYLTAASARYASNPERFNVDFRTYEFIAAVPSGRVHFARTDVKPGLKTSADIAKAQGLIVGGLSREGPKDMAMRLTLDMLGVPYKYVTGYKSSPAAMLAMQRNEISYYADSPSNYVSTVEPQVKSGVLVPAFYDPGFNGSDFIVPKQMKAFPIQSFPELYNSINGQMPSGPLWEAYKALLVVNGTMYRLIAMPPETPKAAVAAWRKAVLSLNEDKDYLDEAQKIMGEAPEYVTGADMNDHVRAGLSIKPEVKAFMDDYVKQAR